MMKNTVLNNRLKQVDRVTNQTHDDLNRNRDEIIEKVEEKERRVAEEFKMKKQVLKANFNENLAKLVKNIRTQREIVSASYGSLTLQNKKEQKPIFGINPDIDPEGFESMKSLEKYEKAIPQILNVRIK